MTTRLARRRWTRRRARLARRAGASVLAAACLLTLAGCAYEWRKPHVQEAAADSALATCDLVAQRNAVAAAPRPAPVRLPGSSTDLSNPAWNVPQEVLTQQVLRNQCMRERGYRLERETEALR